MHTDEKQLISKLREGDDLAFRQLYNDYGNKIYNITLSYLQNIEDAQDLTQEIFIKINTSIKNFQENSSLNTWIYRVTINHAINELKRKKRLSFFRQIDNMGEVEDFNHPGVILEKSENARFFYMALERLPEKQKTAIILGYLEELPRKNIAAIMGTSLKSVESLLQRGKGNLKKNLEKLLPDRRI